MNVDMEVWFDDNGHLMAREVNVHLAEIWTPASMKYWMDVLTVQWMLYKRTSECHVFELHLLVGMSECQW